MRNFERHQQILGSAVDESSRTVYLFDEINNGASFRFCVGMDLLNETSGPIFVKLSTPGGDVDSGMAIFDAIKQSRNPVTVIGTGPIKSMGAIILQAGVTRLMTPEARYMIHNGSVDIDGGLDSEKLIAAGREMEFELEHHSKIISDRTGMPIDRIQEMMTKEAHFSAEEALNHGFIDGIFLGVSRKNRKTNKKRGKR